MFLNLVKKVLSSFIMKKIFGAAIGGIKGFIFSFLFNKVWKEILQPALTKAWRFVQKELRERELREIAKKTKGSKDAKDHKSAVDDLFD